MTAQLPEGVDPERWLLMSPAEKIALQPGALEFLLDQMTHEQILGLMDSWEEFWARPSQIEPPGDWREWLLLTGRGYGKALDLNTPIPTPSGWTTMGAIEPGDIVFDENGKPTTVTFVSNIEMPEVAYRVNFSDGTHLDACPEHQWVTLDARSRKSAKSSNRDWANRPVITTQQMFETQRYSKRGDRNHCIPVAQALDLPDVDLPIDPYVLGYWLGDGTSKTAEVTIGDEDAAETLARLTERGAPVSGPVRRKPDSNCATYPIGGKPSRWADGGFVPNGSMHSALKVLGQFVIGKHVPTAYLRGSEDQRRALLQGLMDSDGYGNPRNGQVEFCSTSELLANAVVELARSLGQKPVIAKGRATLYGVDHGPKYRVTWRPTTPVFLLERKAQTVRPNGGAQGSRNHRRMITSVEPITPVPMRCISVDSPNRMYLAGEAMIPTHNTRTCAEWCYKRVLQGSRAGFLLGRTTEQVRDIQVKGPDGLLAIAEAHGTPWEYKSSEALVVTHTGSTWKMHTSEKPDGVRGPTYDCLTAGHQIDMADGGTMPIEEIRVGDLVATRFGPRRVTHLFRKTKPTIRLELNDGRAVEGGEMHAVWTRSHGWATLRAIMEEPCLYEFATAAQSSSPLPAGSIAATIVDVSSTTPSNEPSGSSSADDAASSSTRTTASRKTATTAKRAHSSASGKRRTARSPRATASIIGTTTTGITGLRTSNFSRLRSMQRITVAGLRGSLAGATRLSESLTSARSAESRTSGSRNNAATSGAIAPTAASGVSSVERTGVQTTYDFTVAEVHEYLSEGFVHHNTGWVEEFATLKAMVGSDGMTAFDNARFTLRAVGGLQPRLVMATTPKRVKAVKKMLLEHEDPKKKIHLTRGSLTENSSNLSDSFVEGILDRYAGTALGQQEIDGELASDVEGAIFSSLVFNASRITDERDLPELLRPILSLDPSSGDGTGDECGMTVQALSAGTMPTEVKHGTLAVIKDLRHGYVLEDASIAGDPDEWANHAVATCEKWGIIEVVAEGNQGGQMIKSLLKARNPSLRVRIVHARVGKEARAQPIAGLFSQGRWHMVGEHPDLEDQGTTWVPGSGGKSPDRVDALCWGATYLEPGVNKRQQPPATPPGAFGKNLG